MRPFPLLESLSLLHPPLLFFVFGVWRCRGRALVLQEGCEELSHKENVPHCLQGDGGCQMEQGFFFFFFLALLFGSKWQLHSDGCFLTWTGSFIYAGFCPRLTPNFGRLLNVKCYLLMSWLSVWHESRCCVTAQAPTRRPRPAFNQSMTHTPS